MKTYIRQRLRESLIENKKTTHTGANRPAYGGRGDNVYFFQYGDLQDFDTHYKNINSKIIDKIKQDTKSSSVLINANDSDVKYGGFRFKITVNKDGGPNIQGIESSPSPQSPGCVTTKSGNVLMCNVDAPLSFNNNYLGKMLKFKLLSGKTLIFKILARFGDDNLFFSICDNNHVQSKFFKNNVYVINLNSLNSTKLVTKYVHTKNISDFENYTKDINSWTKTTFNLEKPVEMFNDDGENKCNLDRVIQEFQGLPVPFIPIRDYLKRLGPSRRKETKMYNAYVRLLDTEYQNIKNFINVNQDKYGGYLDDKAADISKEKTPEKYKYKLDKLGRHEKSPKQVKALSLPPEMEELSVKIIDKGNEITKANMNRKISKVERKKEIEKLTKEKDELERKYKELEIKYKNK